MKPTYPLHPNLPFPPQSQPNQFCLIITAINHNKVEGIKCIRNQHRILRKINKSSSVVLRNARNIVRSRKVFIWIAPSSAKGNINRSWFSCIRTFIRKYSIMAILQTTQLIITALTRVKIVNKPKIDMLNLKLIYIKTDIF